MDFLIMNNRIKLLKSYQLDFKYELQLSVPDTVIISLAEQGDEGRLVSGFDSTFDLRTLFW